LGEGRVVWFVISRPSDMACIGPPTGWTIIN